MEWFIQIHRKLIDWEWYKNWNVFIIFIHCLLKANWKDKKWEWNIIRRWEFITSYQNLANELSWKHSKFTVMQVRTALKKLNVTWELTIKTTNKFTLIKVNNYNEYQKDNKQHNNQITIKQQSNNNQITTTKKEKKENKEKKEKNIVVATKVATLNLEFIIKEKVNLKYFIDNYNSTQEHITKELKEFYYYRSEKKPNWKKERWQMQKTFDVNLRFHNRLKNNKNTNKYKNHENIESIF